MKKINILLLAATSLLLAGCASTYDNDNGLNNDVNNNTNTTNYDEIEDRTKLDLSNQGLTSLPNDTFNRVDLVELDISDNKLRDSLPAEIRNLTSLRILRANDNEMTGLPAEIGQLTNLEILDLSDNNLTGLPREIANLRNLKELDISGNNYSEEDVKYIEERLPDSVNIQK